MTSMAPRGAVPAALLPPVKTVCSVAGVHGLQHHVMHRVLRIVASEDSVVSGRSACRYTSCDVPSAQVLLPLG